MESSTTVLTTLHSITSIKRNELAKQRDACKALRAELLEPLKTEKDKRARVRMLLKDAGKRIPHETQGATWRRSRKATEMLRKKESNQHEEILNIAGISAPNVQRFLEQSERDASVSPRFFEDIEEKLQSALRAQEIKYEYATLFNDLVTERASERPDAAESAETDGSASTSDFEAVGRNEMHEQRQEWESLVFNTATVQTDEITTALENTFGQPEARKALESFRTWMNEACHNLLKPSSVSVEQMKTNVNGLIGSDLLSDDQTAILKQLRDNPTWIREVVDVINLRLGSIERWSWDTDALPLEMRRQLNGKYRVFMHEEITQALLLYHIGITFATNFRRFADAFLLSSGWKKYTRIDKSEQAKYDYFIGHRQHTDPNRTIRKDMKDRFMSSYFMSSLPQLATEGAAGYGDDDLSDDNNESSVKRQIDDKQGLLHLIAAETLLADALNEELIVLQTDFRWFGPSLPHATIFTVLKFFGVTGTWLDFFKKFLLAPLRFLQDGADGAIRTHQRGIPMSHILSDFFGEAILFSVDFAVNEATQGKPMYRLHDDIWFWGDRDQTTAAWEALTRLTKTMGIEINEEKTGAARLTRSLNVAKKSLPSSLPAGSLTWGLLTVKEGGVFEIDQAQVDIHIEELKRQLAARKSVLGWIKAYNTYMKFFSLHFCRTADSLGRAHVDDRLSTFQRINEALATSTKGNIAAYVKEMISSRFDVTGIPDGFIYFPMVVGGLELHNPLITLQNIREIVMKEPMDLLLDALDQENVDYRRLKNEFDESGPVDKNALASEPKEFLSPEEFAVYRRDYNSAFVDPWYELLQHVVEEAPERSSEIAALLQKSINTQGNPLEDEDSEPYWMTVSELYGPEMGRVFGGLYVVEKGLLPLGMLGLFKGRVRWDA